MPDVTKTISVRLNLFGMGPSSKWGEAVSPYTMTWGTTLWGEGESIPYQFIKVITGNDIVATSTIELTKNIYVTVSDDLTILGETSAEYLMNGIWDYVFVPNTSNADDRVTTTWTNASQGSTSYVCQTAGSTIWT